MIQHQAQATESLFHNLELIARISAKSVVRSKEI
jgi:hypothetical protein